jgi:hypothetical protein
MRTYISSIGLQSTFSSSDPLQELTNSYLVEAIQHILHARAVRNTQSQHSDRDEHFTRVYKYCGDPAEEDAASGTP